MTSARQYKHKRINQRDLLIAAEIRAEIAKRLDLTQGDVAAQVFSESQQWFNRRVNGEVAFTTSEVLDIANFLGIDIVVWLNATKHSPNGPASAGVAYLPTYARELLNDQRDDEGQQTTAEYIAPLLCITNDEWVESTPPAGNLVCVA